MSAPTEPTDGTPEPWTAYERETVINANDADELVRIWSAQLPVIRRLRSDARFTEIRSGEHWAEFTIPTDQWNPVTGAKRSSARTPAQQAATQAGLAKLRAKRMEALASGAAGVQDSDGGSAGV